MKTATVFLTIFFLMPRSSALADSPTFIQDAFSGVNSYYVVELQRSPGSPETYYEFPFKSPREMSGDFLAAGKHLFRSKGMKQGTMPFPAKEFLDLIKTYDPNAQFPPLRCPWNPVLGVVLLDDKTWIKATILIGTCYDSVLIDDRLGQNARLLFRGHVIDPLVQVLAPGYDYQK